MPRIFGQTEGVPDPVHLLLPGPTCSLEYGVSVRLYYSLPDGTVPAIAHEDIVELRAARTIVGPPNQPPTERTTFDSRQLWVVLTWMGAAGKLYLCLRSNLDTLDSWLSAAGDPTATPPKASPYGTDPKSYVILRQILVSNSHDWQAI